VQSKKFRQTLAEDLVELSGELIMFED